MAWADQPSRVLEVDARRRPACGEEMQLIAAITDPSVACRILECLAPRSRTPPLAPARQVDRGSTIRADAREPTSAEADRDSGFDFDPSRGEPALEARPLIDRLRGCGAARRRSVLEKLAHGRVVPATTSIGRATTDCVIPLMRTSPPITAARRMPTISPSVRDSGIRRIGREHASDPDRRRSVSETRRFANARSAGSPGTQGARGPRKAGAWSTAPARRRSRRRPSAARSSRDTGRLRGSSGRPPRR